MNSSQIRTLAIILMLIDHVGMAFFPQHLQFRIIGRLAFPLFAWLIANGFKHTKNVYKYLGRLIVLALISQYPFQLFMGINNQPPTHLNIFFTLALGLSALIISTSKMGKLIKTGSILFLLIIAEIFQVDYGMFGILSILVFHKFYSQHLKTFFFQVLVWSLSLIYSFLTTFGNSINLNILSVFSIFFIKSYNLQPGKAHKWLFYGFYPAHLLVIYLIKLAVAS